MIYVTGLAFSLVLFRAALLVRSMHRITSPVGRCVAHFFFSPLFLMIQRLIVTHDNVCQLFILTANGEREKKERSIRREHV